MDGDFDKKAEAYITGTVYNYEEKENSYAVYLKDIYVLFKDNEKGYNLSRLLVYIKEEPFFKMCSRLKICGYIYKFDTPSNPGQFNQKQYFKEKNIYYMAYAETVVQDDAGYSPFLEKLHKFRKSLEDVYSMALPGKECGIISTMVLGSKTLLDMDMRSLYQQSGIGHLLAISGLHISIICIAVYKFIRALLILFCNIIQYIYKVLYNSMVTGSLELNGREPVTLKYINMVSVMAKVVQTVPVFITAGFLYLYGVITGFSISTSRAVIMMVLMLLAPIINRSYDMVSAMAASAVIILLQKPFAVYSCSFLLSFGAVVGIVVVYPVLKSLYKGRPEDINGYNLRIKYIQKFEKFLKTRHSGKTRFNKRDFYKYLLMHLKYLSYIIFEKIIDLFLSSLSIQIITFPVILYFYYEFPLYGIFINIIVLPLVSLLVITAAVGGLAGLACLPLAKFVLGSAYILLNIYETVCKVAAKLPYNIIITGRPENWQIIIYFIILFFIFYIVIYKDYKNSGFVAAIISLLFFLIIYTKRYNELNVSFLDTGQGDAVFIQDKEGVVYLIDGGSSSVKDTGRYRIIPFLKYNGISKIDYMIMTHPDEDHISGLKEILEQSNDGIKVSCLLVPDPADKCKDKAYYNIINLASQNNINTRYIKPGDILLSKDSFHMECLHPQEGFNADSANAYSTVLSVTYGDNSFLFTGDIEGNGENALLERLVTDKTLPVHYNVLKVAHHGSKNSSSDAFLKRVSPDISIISCGENNTYGHPHKELLERIENSGSRWVATKDAGAVTVLSDGQNITIKSYKN